MSSSDSSSEAAVAPWGSISGRASVTLLGALPRAPDVANPTVNTKTSGQVSLLKFHFDSGLNGFELHSSKGSELN